MTYAQTAFTGGTGARPITAMTRRIARDLEARVGEQVEIADKSELFRTVKQACVALGLGAGARETLEHLMGYTRIDDWKGDRTPVVWPSNLTLAEMAGRTVGAIKARLRQLRLAGLILARDSGHGRRTGRRDAAGAISSAFGLDLSPLRVRFQELRRLAEAYTAQSRLFNEGRQEIARVRRMVGQALAQAAHMRLTGAHWVALHDAIGHVGDMASAARGARDDGAYRAALDRLPDIERQLATVIDQHMFPDDNNASGSKDAPSIQIQTKPFPFPNVNGQQECSPGLPACASAAPDLPPSPSGSCFKTRPVELMELFPTASAYIGSGEVGWRDIHAVSSRLRYDLGIRIGTYVEALDMLGADGTAVAVMITAERQARGAIQQTAGAYFAGMVAKAKRNELDLARSLWGFRSERMGMQ